MREAAKAFRGETSVASVTRRFSLREPDLAKAYVGIEPDSIEAAGVAYLGAMESRGAKPWVSRLVRASRQRSALSTETDVRLHLPKALQRILVTYHSHPALEAVIDLRMDGAYGYDLDDVRFDALFADPAGWEDAIRSRPAEVPWTPAFARNAYGATRSLAWSLTSDKAKQKQVRGLAQRPGVTPTMRRYANALLRLAKLNEQRLTNESRPRRTP
jgi:hypothetical protein